MTLQLKVVHILLAQSNGFLTSHSSNKMRTWVTIVQHTIHIENSSHRVQIVVDFVHLLRHHIRQFGHKNFPRTIYLTFCLLLIRLTIV